MLDATITLVMQQVFFWPWSYWSKVYICNSRERTSGRYRTAILDRTGRHAWSVKPDLSMPQLDKTIFATRSSKYAKRPLRRRKTLHTFRRHHISPLFPFTLSPSTLGALLLLQRYPFICLLFDQHHHDIHDVRARVAPVMMSPSPAGSSPPLLPSSDLKKL